ncbi:DUF4292 domain-containing protein [Hymenobacter weizhouensis]|uniref:DUF4292 domain-containing protein n=1 Tax=Hymenobacter sp. YIM 151500-1 TaxID=2987689 RepID=UPI00222745D5|nr:DUF4292 domain-containing protein [Hymenobacter sp. YIM 151500-1]UYZ62745.1 DUF4292 domain-containing protein [Hymenobacter sp. YIM 151500-1]
MSNRVVLVLCAVLGLTSAGCSRKLLPGKSAAAAAKTPEMVKATNVEFRYLKARGKVSIDFPGVQQTANVNVRVRRDSVIWMSASLGIEGFRAYITRDSVKVLFPLQREYYAGDYAYLSRLLNVPVTFERVQALLLGDYLPVTPAGEVAPTVATEGPMQRVQYEQRGLLVQQLIDIAKGRVQQLSVQDQQTQNSLTVDYSAFQPLPPRNQLFAHATLLQLKQPQGKPATVSVQYRNVDLDKERLSFPFSVPKGYARKK